MKAWLLESFDGLGAMRLADDVEPQGVGEHEVRIRVHYAALNPADRFLSERLYPAKPVLPHILGRDGCGVVDEVGSGVTLWKSGDRVALLRGDAGVERWGTLAELLTVPAEVLVSIPEGWNEPQAAAGPLVYLTAHQALNQWGEIATPSDGIVLITGVSGGVGLAALHLARAYGFRAIGLTRGTAKHDALRAEGADELFDPTDPDLKKKLKEYTAGNGVNIVVDNIGGPLFNTLLDAMAYKGCISTIGALGGAVSQFNTAKLIFRKTRIGGVYVNDYYGDPAQKAWGEIVSLLTKAGRKPVVDSVHEMGDLRAAFDRLAEGPLGKVVIKVGG